jgi:dTDP-4-amino-4,6-dideoxygalactose transaminase
MKLANAADESALRLADVDDVPMARTGTGVQLDIEARPVWKPLHLQPAFLGAEIFRGEVAEALFRDGICLPSGAQLSEADQARIIELISRVGR